MNLTSALEESRSVCASALAAAVVDHAPCHVEPALRTSDGELALEGHLQTPVRVDLLRKGNGQRVTVNSPVRRPGGTVIASVHDVPVVVEPFLWDNATVDAEGLGPAVHVQLRSWFLQWFDQYDSNNPDAHGLFGVTHFISDPVRTASALQFTVDFGSAPVAACENLLTELALAGASAVCVS
jgi:hypothetical protein